MSDLSAWERLVLANLPIHAWASAGSVCDSIARSRPHLEASIPIALTLALLSEKGLAMPLRPAHRSTGAGVWQRVESLPRARK